MIIREGNLDEVKANFPPQAKSIAHFLQRALFVTLYRDNSDINCLWFCFVLFSSYSNNIIH